METPKSNPPLNSMQIGLRLDCDIIYIYYSEFFCHSVKLTRLQKPLEVLNSTLWMFTLVFNISSSAYFAYIIFIQLAGNIRSKRDAEQPSKSMQIGLLWVVLFKHPPAQNFFPHNFFLHKFSAPLALLFESRYCRLISPYPFSLDFCWW